MKRAWIPAVAVLCSGALVPCQAGLKPFPVLKGPYLGQAPPGTKPEVFAPGIVSTGLFTRDVAMSPAGDEIYFGVADGGSSFIFETKLVAGHWTEPAVAPFSGKGFLDFEPHVSQDGHLLFFLSNRPPPGRDPKSGWAYQHIWVTARAENGWGEPRLVDPPVNTEANEFFPSVTRENTLYFTRSRKDGAARIYKSRFVNGHYGEPEMLPFKVPETAMLFNAFISPGEDYLITCALNIDPTNEDQDYYISFKSAAGLWSDLIRLGPEINPPDDNANSAFVSPEGKYLFFSSSRRDPAKADVGSGTTLRALIDAKSEPGHGASAIYWVDARILEELKPAER